MADDDKDDKDDNDDPLEKLLDGFEERTRKVVNGILDERLRVNDPPPPKEGEPPAKDPPEDDPPQAKTLAERLGF
jgi:hypothetical protein